MDNYEYEEYLPMQYFYMRSEIIRNNPELQLLVSDSLVMIDSDKFNEYKTNDLIDININNNVSQISSSLLHDILFDEGMYKYLLTSLDYDSEKAASILLLKDNSIQDRIVITKAVLVNAINTLDITSLPSIIQTRIAIVLAMTNAVVCFNKYTDETYKCVIDNEEVEIPCVNLIRLLTCSDNDYRLFLSGNTKSNLSKQVIAYMLVDFVISEGLFDKYVFDDFTYNRFNELKEYKSIDFESMNKLNKSDDVDVSGKSLLDQFTINKELTDKIFEDMNHTYSKLEKSIYIYIRLCDLLTYDQDFYASQSKNEKYGDHKDINNIYAITPDDNEVVSYEFMLIYAKLLREIGIKYSLDLSSIGGFSDAKSSIKFKDGEYLVSIDLFDDEIRNDMSMIKIGASLNCIKSYNTNEVTRKKFNETLYNVFSEYNQIKERKFAFNNLVEEYNNKYKNDIEIPFRKKLYLLLKLISRRNLKGLDNINYFKEMFNIIFKEEDDISIEIVAKKYMYHFRPVVLITKDNYTFLVDPNDYDSVKVLSREQIDDLYNKNIISNIDNKSINGENNHVGSIKK